MVDQRLLTRLADYGEVNACDTVLEVGAGFGLLTKILAERAGKVIAAEIDKGLIRVLRRELAHNANVEIVPGNFFTANITGYNKVVCNPPYKESSNLLFHMLGRSFDLAVLTLQREFTQRLTAEPDSEHYGRLTVMAYMKADFEVMEDVPSRAFYPSPEVSSTVVRIKPKPKPPFHVVDWRIFEEVVRWFFTQRRRKVRKAMQTLAKAHPALSVPMDRFPSSLSEARVFELRPEDFGTIVDIIARINTQP